MLAVPAALDRAPSACRSIPHNVAGLQGDLRYRAPCRRGGQRLPLAAAILVAADEGDRQVAGEIRREPAREREKLVEVLAGDQLVAAGAVHASVDHGGEPFEGNLDHVSVEQIGIV